MLYSNNNSVEGNYSESYTADPRWPTYAKYPSAITRQMDGYYHNTYIDKAFQYPQGGPSGPFDFTTLTTTYTVNSKASTEVYDAALKKWTYTSPVGRITETVTSDIGDVASTKFASFAPVAFSRYAQGRVQTMTQSARQTDLTYDNSGRLSSVENPLNQIASYQYDNANRITQITLPDSWPERLTFSRADGSILFSHLGESKVFELSLRGDEEAAWGDPLDATVRFDIEM